MTVLALKQPEPARALAPAETILEAKRIAKRFGATEVLSNVSFSVGKGECVALLGANGAGKSTLLRSCLRLIEPDAGELRLLGTDVHKLRGPQLRRLRAQVGFVFQRHNLVPRLSALSNVLHGALARGAGARSWLQQTAPTGLREEAMDCLARVGLADIAGRRADRLSGGQSQRVAIGRALMQRPGIMFADEPVASLDPAAGEEVMAMFSGLMRREGLTLVFTTHNLRHALDHADRIVALRNGQIEIDALSSTLNVQTLRSFYG